MSRALPYLPRIVLLCGGDSMGNKLFRENLLTQFPGDFREHHDEPEFLHSHWNQDMNIVSLTKDYHRLLKLCLPESMEDLFLTFHQFRIDLQIMYPTTIRHRFPSHLPEKMIIIDASKVVMEQEHDCCTMKVFAKLHVDIQEQYNEIMRWASNPPPCDHNDPPLVSGQWHPLAKALFNRGFQSHPSPPRYNNEDYKYRIMVLVVMFCDGYFALPEKQNPTQRFMSICSKLPMELQFKIITSTNNPFNANKFTKAIAFLAEMDYFNSDYGKGLHESYLTWATWRWNC